VEDKKTMLREIDDAMSKSDDPSREVANVREKYGCSEKENSSPQGTLNQQLPGILQKKSCYKKATVKLGCLSGKAYYWCCEFTFTNPADKFTRCSTTAHCGQV